MVGYICGEVRAIKFMALAILNDLSVRAEKFLEYFNFVVSHHCKIILTTKVS